MIRMNPMNGPCGSMKRWLSVLLICSMTALLLMACQPRHQTMRPDASGDDALRQRIETGPWKLVGKLAMSDGENSGSGRLWWQKDAGLNKVEFKAPLGQGHWKLQETPDAVRLFSSVRGSLSDASAKDLLSAEVGWPVPWDSIQYWLFGQSRTHTWSRAGANSGAESNQKTKQEINQLSEDGWAVSYSRYKATALGRLPHKIIARKGPYRVKVFISHWEFPVPEKAVEVEKDKASTQESEEKEQPAHGS